MDFIEEINEKFQNNTIHLGLKAKLYGKVRGFGVILSKKIGFPRKSEEIRLQITEILQERGQKQPDLQNLN